MTFSLKTITFNHDVTSATTSALNIRKNKDFETALPEYDSAIPRNAQEQCAAYAIATTSGQEVFVRCMFRLDTAAIADFEVRATGGGVGLSDGQCKTRPRQFLVCERLQGSGRTDELVCIGGCVSQRVLRGAATPPHRAPEADERTDPDQ